MSTQMNKEKRKRKKLTKVDVLWYSRAVFLCALALVLSLYPFREAFYPKIFTMEIVFDTVPVLVPIYIAEAETGENENIVAIAEEVDANETKEVNEYDKELLALVIYQEAGADYCSDDTRRMVGEVVLNRVADSRFPDTIEEVLLQKQQYGRLYWTGLVWSDRASLPEEADAVERAYRIAEELLTSDERLLPCDTIYQSEYVQGKEIVAESDGIYFCK